MNIGEFRMLYSADIKRFALDLGFLDCGIIPANVFGEYNQALDERINKFPQSRSLYERLYRNARQSDAAKSVIVCTTGFGDYLSYESLKHRVGRFYLFDGRINYSNEYRSRLEFETFLKTLGLGILNDSVPARLAAAKAGIGKFGRNNFLYDPVHGSNVMVYTWVVDEQLEYDDIASDYYLPICNDGCNKCIDSCPTKALSGSFEMDMGKCIARIVTTPTEEELPKGVTLEQLGTWIYGCDACQEVCPANIVKFDEMREFPLLEAHLKFLSLEEILDMNEDVYSHVVNPRFWYAGEEALWLWKCNALRSMVNSGDPKYHSLIEQYCEHDDERIRAIALWGRSKMQ